MRGQVCFPKKDNSMSIITVEVSKKYDILVEERLLSRAGEEIRARFKKAQQIMLVSDDTVNGLYGEVVTDSLVKSGFTVHKYIFPHGETSKTFSVMVPLVERMAELALTRSDLIVALGGGVVGDMAGFAAAIYLRGIDFVQIPTTLLSAVDSSVGGKTAVDLAAGKNLAGAFHQPSLVLCDYSTLYSLPEEEFATGMAEVIKHGVLADRELFAFIAEKDAKAYLGDIIPTNLVIKRRHVMEDEFDVGLRQLLNLGHTLAHAVEKLSDYEINHGNAVSIGLAAICRAAYAYGLAEEDITDSVVAVLKKYHLMTECPYTAAECVGVLLNDKKRSGQTINLAIPKKIGECYLYKMDVDRLEEFYRLAIG